MAFCRWEGCSLSSNSTDLTGQRGPRRKGNPSRCARQVQRPVPVPTWSSRPIPKGQPRSPSPWGRLAAARPRAGPGQEAGGSGRKEVGKEAGPLAPLTPSPTGLPDSSAAFPKILTVGLN